MLYEAKCTSLVAQHNRFTCSWCVTAQAPPSRFGNLPTNFWDVETVGHQQLWSASCCRSFSSKRFLLAATRLIFPLVLLCHTGEVGGALP